MKKELKILVYFDMIFIVLLGVAGALSGIVSDAVYYFSFILPLLLYFLLKTKGKIPSEQISAIPNKESFFISGVLTAPLVAVVFLLSMLTSLLLGPFGLDNGVETVEKITFSILLTALVPAVLEELLFRYVPLSLLKGKGRRDAVFFSALLFSLSHCDIFQLPYAFLAGAVFAALDILAGSIWPSVIMHLLNNAVSVFWLRYGGENATAFMIILFAAALVSLLVALILRADVFKRIFEIFKEKPRERVTPEVWIFILTTAALTGASLLEAIWK